MAESPKINIKIALVGDCGVGKSSIALRYTKNEFVNNYISTGGASYSNKIIEKNGEVLQLDIWDTAGQEKFRSLGKNFYKDAFIILLVYDITLKESFENLKKIWYVEIMQNGEEKPLLAIVGNKSDQYEEENIVNEEVARQFANEIKGIFQLVSAKTGDNIENLFNILLDSFFKLKFPDKIKEYTKRRNSSKLIDDKNNKNKGDIQKKKKCC